MICAVHEDEEVPMTVSLAVRPGAAFDEWEHQICRTFVPLRAKRQEAALADFRGGVASDRKSTRLNSSHSDRPRMPSSA